MKSNDGTLRLYPRGFLGATINQVGNVVEANSIIESLYSQYIKNNIATDAPEFRRQIIKAALAAFGTFNFLGWFEMQPKSASYGDMHNRFLMDTLRFINVGRRDLSLESWSVLLKGGAEQVNADFNNDVVRYFFNAHEPTKLQLTAQTNIMVTDVIQNWCIQPGGLEDLLGTLHLLFGNV